MPHLKEKLKNIPKITYRHENVQSIGNENNYLREIITVYEKRITCVYYATPDDNYWGASCYLKSKKTIGTFSLPNDIIAKDLFTSNVIKDYKGKLSKKIYFTNGKIAVLKIIIW